MYTNEAKLAAKVAARNRVHQFANEIYDAVSPILAPFVGKKVYRSDGCLLEKVRKLLPEFETQQPSILLPYSQQCWRNVSKYHIAWNVQAVQSYNGDRNVLQEAMVYIAWVRDGNLTEIVNAPAFRTDYTFEDIMQKRKDFVAAKNAYEAAQNALFPFGEND